MASPTSTCRFLVRQNELRPIRIPLGNATPRSYVSDEYGMSDTEAGNLYAAYGFACTGLAWGFHRAIQTSNTSVRHGLAQVLAWPLALSSTDWVSESP